MKPASSTEGRRESPLLVLGMGALMLLFLWPALVVVVTWGPIPTVTVGGVLLVLALYLPTTREARILRVMLGVIAVGLFVAAAIDTIGIVFN